MTPRNRPFTPSLKAHPVYKADREAKLARLAVETPDCEFVECSDCCYLERHVPKMWVGSCPECGGRTVLKRIVGGEVHA